MRIEILCTGDELLTGLTTDTNSPYFMGKLFELGETVARSQTVGDVREHIVEALTSLRSQCDAVLVSGGLGPTADDLTAECAAAAAGVRLIENAEVLAELKARFAKRNFAFTPNNAKQALIPEGAEVVRNPVGTAPMFIQRIGRCTLFFVPGVPREYRALVDGEVLPRIAKLIAADPNRVFRAARLLKTIGLAESHLDAKVAPLAKIHPRVTFGFRTHAPENHLKLLAEGGTQREADEALAAAERDCREALKPHVFGADRDSFASVLGALLRECGATVGVAESCTGGSVCELLSAPAGASSYFIGGAVVYANAMKEKWAGVRPDTLRAHGAVSKEVSIELAEGVRRACETTYGLSITGVAGPSGGTPDKPVGTVHFALATSAGTQWQQQRMIGDRERIRLFAAAYALDILRRHLLGVGF